jgi:hypothetical protein
MKNLGRQEDFQIGGADKFLACNLALNTVTSVFYHTK